MRNLLTLFFSLSFFVSVAQYAPAAGKLGSTAIHMDSSIIISWANQCVVNRGWQNAADHSLGKTSVGNQSSAIGKADNNVISLGDGGTAILQFSQAITNGPGPDFAIFENAFDDYFLELAFVEVSSDGITFFRFPAHSLTQTDSQITTFGKLQADKLHNLAGKYRASYGTPFDLEDLKNINGLDIMHITHIKIIDVVGSIDHTYASYDNDSNTINDPFPTPFPVGGFDLDAVAALHLNTAIKKPIKNLGFKIYPNPASNNLHIDCKTNSHLQIYSLLGKLALEQGLDKGINSIPIQHLAQGVYLLHISSDRLVEVRRFIKE